MAELQDQHALKAVVWRGVSLAGLTVANSLTGLSAGHGKGRGSLWIASGQAGTSKKKGRRYMRLKPQHSIWQKRDWELLYNRAPAEKFLNCAALTTWLGRVYGATYRVVTVPMGALQSSSCSLRHLKLEKNIDSRIRSTGSKHSQHQFMWHPSQEEGKAQKEYLR